MQMMFRKFWMGVAVAICATAAHNAQAETIALQSAHGKYVVAESNGAANANRGAIGPWERWALIRHGDGTVSLRSHHGLYLVAESNGTANANRRAIGPWERWRMQSHGDGTVSFHSHHGRWLVAESNGGLNANRPNLGPWERFRLITEAQMTAMANSPLRPVSARWAGTAPLCSASNRDCKGGQPHHWMNSNYGDGANCASGGKVLCVSEPQSHFQTITEYNLVNVRADRERQQFINDPSGFCNAQGGMIYVARLGEKHHMYSRNICAKRR